MGKMIGTKTFESGKRLPLVVQPVVDNLSLLDWARENRDSIETLLLKHGGVLFRSFNVNGSTELEQLISVFGELLVYQDRATPRSLVSGKIYTSTDTPAQYSIYLHNENSFAYTFPLKIFFFCMTPAQQGGETPVADVRKVFERINPKIRDRFIQKQVMYVRNFGSVFSPPWQTVFQSTDKTELEEFCRRTGIEVEWKKGDGLRTRQVRPALAKHPRTGEMVWFNHATVLHVSTIEPARREGMLKLIKKEDLPHNTYYGDGSPIEPLVLDAPREAYRQEMVIFHWRKGDILMLDNMLTAHGRMPFVGTRKVVVGMAEPLTWDDV